LEELTLRLPGLVDPHVHLREPGATHKEDFDSGTAAALAGGFTAVLAMPNTSPAISDEQSLGLAKQAARTKARCDFGIYLGATQGNVGTAAKLADQAIGLKMYLDQTYGPLQLEGMKTIVSHAQRWPSVRPIAAHAEGRSLAIMLLLAAIYQRPVHICHVSRRDEIQLIRLAKEKGMPVTCEATPHHLFLTEDDLPSLGKGRGRVQPRLASADDQEALWANLDVIDCFATDHAPHTAAEKDGQDSPPGFPGLETALGLFFNALEQARLTIEDVVARMHTNPKRIFGLADQPETYAHVEEDAVWEVCAGEMHSRCGWTPFEGMRLRGRVRRVVLRGREAYADGEVLAEPGTGCDLIRPERNLKR
jgi:carbamoyl-phosphate synthase/aspartate carbamoyltransferase/dihydroorotase